MDAVCLQLGRKFVYMFYLDLFRFIPNFVALGTVLQGATGVFGSRVVKLINAQEQACGEEGITHTGANFN
jgi:hypothetical protein